MGFVGYCRVLAGKVTGKVVLDIKSNILILSGSRNSLFEPKVGEPQPELASTSEERMDVVPLLGMSGSGVGPLLQDKPGVKCASVGNPDRDDICAGYQVR